MPIYEFSNPDEPTEVVSVFMSMNDNHEYYQNGVKWDRVWSVPGVAMDTIIDPYNSADFMKKTQKPGKMGDLFDLSSELSAKRAERDGIDPIKEKSRLETAARDKKIREENKKMRSQARTKGVN